MEYINAILYHKIQDSDFTNMYGVKKPSSGGGQTYIQAAGYRQEELDRMFHDADSIYATAEYWDKEKTLPRNNYTICAHTLGSPTESKIELAPRTGRADYRICRQNIKYRHPAWTAANGFPEPRKGTDNRYIYEKNYPGLIDTLYILILKTRSNDGGSAFYATYVNTGSLPLSWPGGASLEEIFSKKKNQGILFFDKQFLRFVNDSHAPFQIGSAMDDEIGPIQLPKNLLETPDDAVEYARSDISISINYQAIRIQEVEPPAFQKRKKQDAGSAVSKDMDYERRSRNQKRIGDAGEAAALEAEKRRLAQEGRSDLISEIKHVSATEGDGLGYDIISYEKINGMYQKKYIEVKATTGGMNKPFDISSNEVAVSAVLGDQYSIFRVFGISENANELSYYEVRGPIQNHFVLEPTSYKAFYKP